MERKVPLYEVIPDNTTIELLGRYQECTRRIWHLFPTDPLGDDCPAHFLIDRLEAILDQGLLAPKPPDQGFPVPAKPNLWARLKKRLRS